MREILADIVQDNSRAGDVIYRMLALVKKETLQFASLDLSNVVGDVAFLLRSDAILHNIRIVLEINPDLAPVHGQLGRTQPEAQGAEAAASLDGGELAVIADQHHPSLRLVGVLKEAAQLAVE